MLQTGDTAPNFTLLDQNGTEHSLADYQGSWVIVYFYPKDDTPGCTQEACMIRDNYDGFEELGVTVLGISKDSVTTHKKFADKYDLPFTLLADTGQSVIGEYGANGLLFNKRATFLINPDGKIEKVYPKVDPASHATQLIDDIKKVV